MPGLTNWRRRRGHRRRLGSPPSSRGSDPSPIGPRLAPAAAILPFARSSPTAAGPRPARAAARGEGFLARHVNHGRRPRRRGPSRAVRGGHSLRFSEVHHNRATRLGTRKHGIPLRRGRHEPALLPSVVEHVASAAPEITTCALTSRSDLSQGAAVPVCDRGTFVYAMIHFRAFPPCP